MAHKLACDFRFLAHHCVVRNRKSSAIEGCLSTVTSSDGYGDVGPARLVRTQRRAMTAIQRPGEIGGLTKIDDWDQQL